MCGKRPLMKTLFVTGGIGSGKSLVCRMLVERGFPVYDSDARTKDLYDSDPVLLAQVVEVMRKYAPEKELVGADGRLDRRALASVIFSDGKALEALESVVHPAVLRDFENWRDALADGQTDGRWERAAVMESAIVLEKPLFKGVADLVLLVDAPLEIRRRRAALRDGVSEEVVEARMQRQTLLNDISSGLAAADADCVIVNDGGPADLARKLDDFLDEYLGIY